jgi:type VI secretion system VasD/TssJ family lipoprotein
MNVLISYMRRPTFVAVMILVPVLSLALTGCRSLCVFGLGCSPSVEVRVQGEEAMNGGNAASVVIYQLTNDTKFRTTPIEAFWKDDEAALGNEMIGRKREVLMYPLQLRFIDVSLEPKANFVAVAANLRNPESDSWRRIFPVEDIKNETLRVRVDENEVTVSIQ